LIAVNNKVGTTEERRRKEMAIDPKSTYYDAGDIETISIIKAKLTPEQFEGFLLGSILKYSCRANFKGTFNRDLEKAETYLTMLNKREEDGNNNS